MKFYTIEQSGQVPSSVLNIIYEYMDRPANKDTFRELNETVSFLVNDCRECHGNIDQGVKVGGAWLSSMDNSWHVWVRVKG